MDNVFFEFVETYWEEIAEFFKALRNWIEALMSKVNSDDTATDE